MQPVRERFVITVPNQHTFGLAFTDNETVAVRILSPLQNGSVRIAVKGHIMTAKTSSDLREGVFLLMRVQLVNNTLVLHPYCSADAVRYQHSDVFAQLGIPPSELAGVLISLFIRHEQPLLPQPLLKILALVKSFAPHEKKAAFIATLLSSRGIEPTEQLIMHCLSALFALPFDTGSDAAESENADFFRLINHLKAKRLHWVVFPFKKEYLFRLKGSVAFLLDMEETHCLECRIRAYAEENAETWTFALKDGECVFSCLRDGEPPALPEQKQLTALLSSCFADAGITAYSIRYGTEEETGASLASIDISV